MPDEAETKLTPCCGNCVATFDGGWYCLGALNPRCGHFRFDQAFFEADSDDLLTGWKLFWVMIAGLAILGALLLAILAFAGYATMMRS